MRRVCPLITLTAATATEGTRSLTITVATHHRSCQWWRRVRARLLWLRPRPRYSSLIRPLLRGGGDATYSPPRFTPPTHAHKINTHTFNRARRVVGGTCARYCFSNRLGNSLFINCVCQHCQHRHRRNEKCFVFVFSPSSWHEWFLNNIVVRIL